MKLLIAILLLGCSEPKPPTVQVPVTKEAGPPVATVNGKRVPRACIEFHLAEGLAPKKATQRCIDFELLAQEAQRRGLAADPRIQQEVRTAQVATLVKDAVGGVESISDDIYQQVYKDVQDITNQGYFTHPEYRYSTYARVPEDQKSLARKIAERLHPHTPLTKEKFNELAADLIPESGEIKDVPGFSKAGLVPEYANVLFNLDEVGDIGGPVLTKWGWDVILLTRINPARNLAYTDAKQEMYDRIRYNISNTVIEGARSRAYQSWYKSILKSLNVNVTLNEDTMQGYAPSR